MSEYKVVFYRVFNVNAENRKQAVISGQISLDMNADRTFQMEVFKVTNKKRGKK